MSVAREKRKIRVWSQLVVEGLDWILMKGLMYFGERWGCERMKRDQGPVRGEKTHKSLHHRRVGSGAGSQRSGLRLLLQEPF